MSTRDELAYKFHNVRSGSILVEVRAKSNAHIALTSKKGDSSPMYEIMLGGWENTASVIRYDRKQPDKVENLRNSKSPFKLLFSETIDYHSLFEFKENFLFFSLSNFKHIILEY